MSKYSKTLILENPFEVCVVRKNQTQKFEPSSAQKGKTFYQKEESHQAAIRNKAIKESQFYLSYRDKNQSYDILNCYRIKSLISPVTQLKASDLRDFEVLGTFDRKIIVGFNDKLKMFCFFDQHAMHQRIRYQYYLESLQAFGTEHLKIKQWNAQIIQKNKKRIPVISGLKHSYINQKVTKKVDSLIETDLIIKKYGFQLQYVKQEMKLKVHKVPIILERHLEDKLVMSIANEIIDKSSCMPKSLKSAIAQISCKSAFKFNDLIDNVTIKELLIGLSFCNYPFFCVHGRPTLFTKI